jgi:type IV pilus assembly protein PilC
MASPLTRRDGDRLIQALNAGQSLGQVRNLDVLNDAVTSALDLAANGRDTTTMLENLARMYQQQAEIRLGMVNTILTPVILVVIACGLGTLVLALFLPLVRLISALV